MVLPIHLIITFNTYLTLILGILINSLLLYLAKRHTVDDLRNYRWVLLYFGILHFILLTLQTIAQQVFFVTRDLISYNFVFGLAAQIPSPHFRLAIYCLYIYCITLTVASLALQFLDRYLTICKSHSSHGRRYSLFALIALIYISISDGTLSLILGLSSMDPNDQRSTRDVLGSDDIFAAKDHSKMAIFMENHSSDNLLVTLFYACCMAGFLLCYCTIVYCYLAIRKFIKKNLKTDIRHRELTRQISNNMLLQAIVPFYCMAIGFMAILPQLSGQFSPVLLHIECLIFVPINWLPVLNPLVTILTIRDYRRALAKMLGILKESTTVTTMAVT